LAGAVALSCSADRRGTQRAASAARKARLGSSALLRELETVQAMVGRAEALLAAARAFPIQAMTDLMEATDIGGDRLLVARVRLQAAAAHAAESALRIVEMLAADAGATAILEACHLERAFRDVHAAAKHIAMSARAALSWPVALALVSTPGDARFGG